MNILIDIGGTNTRITYTLNSTHFETPIVYDTPQNYSDGIQLIASALDVLSEDHEIENIILGITGTLNTPRTKLIASPNLRNYVNKKIQRNLEDLFKTKVKIFNDCELAGLGEAAFGAGIGHKLVGYINIGTGIGGSLIDSLEIENTAVGFEPGHQIIDIQNKKPVSLETLASGSGFLKTKAEKPDITPEQYWDAAHQYLAIGLNNNLLHWSPDILVLGGGIINNGIIDISRLNLEVKKLNPIHQKKDLIVKSKLEDSSGLYGALEISKTL